MTLETAKILGGIGAVLMLVSPIGMHTGIVGIAGVILVLIALSKFAYHYKEPGIFNNVIYGIITAIAGIAIFISVLVVAAYDLIKTLGLDVSWTDWTIFQRIKWQEIFTWETFAPYIIVIVLDLVMLFVLFVVASSFLRRSFSLLGEKTGIHAFKTAGFLIFLGAILTIIAVGLLIMWIALIFLAIGFFSIKTT
ncbi:MAG: DUF996 domain-containing protein [Candidatus Bathyarchaeota archaeon]|nr:DUF996 domain-containing protein [Candidatus Bathyarchaeota archaeon]